MSAITINKKNVYVVVCISVSALLVAACSPPVRHAPVIVDRSTGIVPRVEAGATTKTPQPAQAMPATNVPMRIVKKGETLYSIALETGNDWRDLMAWNNLDNPNRLLLGQQLRLAASAKPTESNDATAPTPGVEVRPLSLPAVPTLNVPTQNNAAKLGIPLPSNNLPAASIATNDDKIESAPKPALKLDESLSGGEIIWAWPVAGKLIEPFAEVKKGIDLDVKIGESVQAAGDGKIVFSGNALRGYGNLVIIKHNAQYFSAYAHNKALFVKEGETVKRGQKIAEAGSTDADRLKLHFEIRKSGKPVDPLKYLPSRS